MNDKTPYDQDQEFQDFDTSADVQDFEDFGDDAALDGDVQASDAEFYDLDGLDDADVFEDTNAVPAGAQKKKPNWFNIGIAGVAVLVAGGLVLSKLLPSMGTDTGSTMAISQPVDSGQDSESSVQAAIAPTSNTGSPMGGMLDNPDAFSGLVQGAVGQDTQTSQVEDDPFSALGRVSEPVVADVTNMPDGLPMPAPISGEVEEVVVTGALPAVNAPAQDDFWSGFDGGAGAPVADVPAPTTVPPVAQMPVQTAAPEMTPAPVTSVPVSAAPVSVSTPAPVVTQADPALRADVDTLNARLNSLEGKIDSALAAAAKAQTQAPAQAANAPNVDLQRIENAISRLEGRIDDLAKTPARTAPASVPAANTETQRPVERAAPKAASVPARAATPKAAAPARSKAENAPYKPATTQASSWRLRGAQPGLAIIAQDNGNVREVRAGDFVPGLGEITGVAQMNGKWVVQGTQGRLSQ